MAKVKENCLSKVLDDKKLASPKASSNELFIPKDDDILNNSSSQLFSNIYKLNVDRPKEIYSGIAATGYYINEALIITSLLYRHINDVKSFAHSLTLVIDDMYIVAPENPEIFAIFIEAGFPFIVASIKGKITYLFAVATDYIDYNAMPNIDILYTAELWDYEVF